MRDARVAVGAPVVCSMQAWCAFGLTLSRGTRQMPPHGHHSKLIPKLSPARRAHRPSHKRRSKWRQHTPCLAACVPPPKLSGCSLPTAPECTARRRWHCRALFSAAFARWVPGACGTRPECAMRRSRLAWARHCLGVGIPMADPRLALGAPPLGHGEALSSTAAKGEEGVSIRSQPTDAVAAAAAAQAAAWCAA